MSIKNKLYANKGDLNIMNPPRPSLIREGGASLSPLIRGDEEGFSERYSPFSSEADTVFVFVDSVSFVLSTVRLKM